MGLIHGWRLRAAFTLLALAAMAMTGVQPARAMSLGETVRVHGYGSWSYRRANNNGYVYNEATNAGNYSNVSGTLNISAQPSENITTMVQANWSLREDRTMGTTFVDTGLLSTPPGPLTGISAAVPSGVFMANPPIATETVNEVELDYAFAEWTYSEALRLRAGQVKLPFGLYTEIWDVGTLRPFLTLPQGIYGGQATVAEAYQGGGLTGVFNFGEWSVQYDAYAGQVTSRFDFFPSMTHQLVTLSDVFGGRIVVFAPIEGLSVGISGYFGLRSDANFLFGERGSGGMHIDYSGENLLLRFEIVGTRSENIATAISGYTEIAYMFFDHLQVAGRVELYKADINQLIRPTVPDGVDEHEDYTIGLNYWFSPNFVIKSSYHYVRGNRFSLPTTFFTDFATPLGGIPSTTVNPDDVNQVVMIGSQFSF